jgi:hypothetical protein
MSTDNQGGQDLGPSFDDRLISLSEWWNDVASSASTCCSDPILLMDLRSSEDYAALRLFSSTPKLWVVALPKEVLKERSFELPARHVEFSILLRPSDVEEAQEFLLGPKHNARKRPRKPWKITNVLLDTPELWKEAKSFGICQESHAEDAAFPLPRLWQPDPMVQTVLLPLLKDLPSADGQIWDLASGSARDVAFLAEELLACKNHPFQVVALDHRYNEKETNVVNGFLDRRGVAGNTACIKIDLSQWGPVEQAMSTKNVAAVYAVRFWKPELVEALAKSNTLQPGTIFGLSHFCKPHKGATWDFDHPSEKTVLERNQLHELFQDQWHILHDEIALDSDHGRTMIHFVARRR